MNTVEDNARLGGNGWEPPPVDEAQARIDREEEEMWREVHRLDHVRRDVPDGTLLPGWVRWGMGALLIVAALVWGIPLFLAGIAWGGGNLP